MNMCIARKSRSNISVELPNYAADKKLAFVESVCEILIKDRFGPFLVYEWSLEGMRAAREPESEPRTIVTVALGRAISDDTAGCSQAAHEMHSRFLSYLRGTATSQTPITIVPGSDTAIHRSARLAALAKGRSSPGTRYSGMRILRFVADAFDRLFSLQPRGSPVLQFQI